MMGYRSWDDGVPGRGGVTTLTSHKSGILHSLILLSVRSDRSVRFAYREEPDFLL